VRAAKARRLYTARLLPQLAEKLDWAAERLGGRGKAIEGMLTHQELPSQDWFREYHFRGRFPFPTKVSLRLSESAVRKLREVTGRRSLSEAIRLLILYTFTDGALGPRVVSGARPTPAARPSVSHPTAAVQSTGRPLSPLPSAGPQSDSTRWARAFSHLPHLPSGSRYRCEDPSCEFSREAGVSTRCRVHSGRYDSYDNP